MSGARDVPHVVVIGAGIVGAATAIELLRDGHRVTILEPGEPGGEQSASYGNGTLLNPSSVIPMSAPGIWRKVPGWLADPLGPLAIRWRYLPRAAALADAVPARGRHRGEGGGDGARVAAAAARCAGTASPPGRGSRRRRADHPPGRAVTSSRRVPISRPRSWPGGYGARTACAGWSCRPMNCASASRGWTAATRSACWWRRTVSAAIPAPMLRHWCGMRWRKARRCGGTGRSASASRGSGCARCAPERARSPQTRR